MTRAGYVGIDTSTLINGHLQKRRCQKKMAAFSVGIIIELLVWALEAIKNTPV